MAPRYFYRTGTVSMNSCKHKKVARLLRRQKNSVRAISEHKNKTNSYFTVLSVNWHIFSYPLRKIKIIPILNKSIVCINIIHVILSWNSSVK